MGPAALRETTCKGAGSRSRKLPPGPGEHSSSPLPGLHSESSPTELWGTAKELPVQSPSRGAQHRTGRAIGASHLFTGISALANGHAWDSAHVKSGEVHATALAWLTTWPGAAVIYQGTSLGDVLERSGPEHIPEHPWGMRKASKSQRGRKPSPQGDAVSVP